MANLYLKTGTNQIIKNNASGSWKLAKDTNCCCSSGACYDKTHHVPAYITATISGTYSYTSNSSCPDPTIFDGTWVKDANNLDCYTCGWGEVFPLVGCCENYGSGYSGNFSIMTALSGAAPTNSHPQHAGDCTGVDGWTYGTTANIYWYTKLLFTCPAIPGIMSALLRVCCSYYSDPIPWTSGTSDYPIMGTHTMYKQTTRDAGFNGPSGSPSVCNEFSWDTIYDTGADNVVCIVNFPSTISIEVF